MSLGGNRICALLSQDFNDTVPLLYETDSPTREAVWTNFKHKLMLNAFGQSVIHTASFQALPTLCKWARRPEDTLGSHIAEVFVQIKQTKCHVFNGDL